MKKIDFFALFYVYFFASSAFISLANAQTCPISNLPIVTGCTPAPSPVLVYEEDFETGALGTLPSGWSYGPGLANIWVIDNDTESQNTGTDTEFCGLQMLVFETSGSANPTMSSVEFPIDLSTITTGNTVQLGFAHYMFGGNVGKLEVLISDNGGTTFNSIYLQNGPDQPLANGDASSWTQVILDLSTYAGNNLTIRMEGTTAGTGTSFEGDILVDAVQVSSTGNCLVTATAAIPTMSQWGLLVFGLLIMNLSVFFIQRRELI